MIDRGKHEKIAMLLERRSAQERKLTGSTALTLDDLAAESIRGLLRCALEAQEQQGRSYNGYSYN